MYYDVECMAALFIEGGASEICLRGPGEVLSIVFPDEYNRLYAYSCTAALPQVCVVQPWDLVSSVLSK